MVIPTHNSIGGSQLHSHTGYLHLDNVNTVYVPIEARYPIEARPPFREQKLHANVYICNKMESLSNQKDI